MVAFQGVLDYCNFIDMGFKGDQYTWWNKQYGASSVMERLDCVLCTLNWRTMFSNAIVHHLACEGSDHWPLLLANINKKTPSGKDSKKRTWRFHFEELWVGQNECASIIEKVWDRNTEANTITSVNKKLENCADQLRAWSKLKYGTQQKDLDKLRSELGLIQRNLSLPDAAERLKVTEDKINKILQDQEIYWKQRSWASWLKWRDRNTRFFHCKASQRQSRNKIWGLIDNNGIWRDEKHEIEAVVVDYFHN
ncbi:Endonuclease/exonuclease/phosphatase [Parasponia andersonii]|uniref:Endonuclease/exonuclease/phosphatase n=1 Tax=Parasponia andersonii TaxID=3476 RepID=A0A2P5DYE7_PARAD|nr:Endonuclease/exonuclease/phosphatase [Parasponia andersonii]